MGTIIEIIADIQDTVDALTGIRFAPDYPPNALPPGLVAETYPVSGVIANESGSWFRELHTVNIDLVMPAKDLERELQVLWPFLRTIPNEICEDPTFGGKASTFDNISYSYITFESAGVLYRGYRFTISGIKVQPSIS